MSDKPEKEAEAASAVRSKGRKAPAIDLPPTEVSDMTGAPGSVSDPVSADAGTTEASPEHKPDDKMGSGLSGQNEPLAAAPRVEQRPTAPASPKLVPGLIGLVAGAIGGFAAYQTADNLRPRPSASDTALVSKLGALEQRLAALKPGEAGAAIPAALAARLEKAESLLADAGKREAGFKAEIAGLANRLAAEADARKKAIEGLASRPGTALGLAAGTTPAATTPAATPADIEGLKSRLGTLENAGRALPGAVSALDGRLKSVQPRIDSVARDVAALSGKLAGLAGREALGAAQARLAAVSLLGDALNSGKPLAQPVKLLGDLGIEAAALAPFTPFLEKAAPDAKALLVALRALRPPPRADAAIPNATLVERLKAGVAALVEVRKTGTVTGNDDTAHLLRAEKALGGGDITTALALVGRLSASAAPTYAAWRGRAEARLKAASALDVQRAQALGALAEAAARK